MLRRLNRILVPIDVETINCCGGIGLAINISSTR